MTYRAKLKVLRIIVPLVLLVMILMRLVWMQLRTYPPVSDPKALITLDFLYEYVDTTCTHTRVQPKLQRQSDYERWGYSWFASPGYLLLAMGGCRVEMLGDRHLVRLNQWLLALTVFFVTLAVRFLTSSWTVALIVATMLLSRGRLLGDIGVLSADAMVMACLGGWFACMTHYLRTGATATLFGGIGFVLLGALLDRALLGLSIAMPLLLFGGFVFRRQLAKPVLSRLRTLNRKMRDYVHQTGAWPEEEGEGVIGRFY